MDNGNLLHKGKELYLYKEAYYSTELILALLQFGDMESMQGWCPLQNSYDL